jgi:hypothetical protein
VADGPTYQPVNRPATPEEAAWQLAQGLVLTLGGDPLVRRPCEWCAGTTVGETCPLSVACPHCGVVDGRRCARPSGHQAVTHPDRAARAEAVDREREDAGDPTVPRRWPPPPTSIQPPLDRTVRHASH